MTSRLIAEGRLRLDPGAVPERVTYHDPCNISRSGWIIDQPRRILHEITSNSVEMNAQARHNYCCGGGGGLVSLDETHDFRMRVLGATKAAQIQATGAEIVATPCANCKKQLRELASFYELPVEVLGVHDLVLRAITADTLSWLVPLNRLHSSRPLYSFASFGFHLGLIPSALFLRSHVEIISAQFGLGWISLAKPWLDHLTLLTIVCGFTLLALRIYNHHASQLSTFADYALLALLLGIFTSGYLAGRPWNPVNYEGLMLSHTLLGASLLIVIPFTKIAHCVLYPILRLGSEIGWRFRAGDGEAVVSALHGPEGRSL